ncbi:uncharacterized protein LOC121387962 [Gigantopelta aegis]|uniref:uncharacterized protein LOC121387962 n=1 Tax=Gigantopelta aegis TaxID=1735272 RepID=UPI001B887709|nr:uncharacterized protein LOC121387962 [Gigantopelta aegis]
MDKELQRRELSWQNCLSFGADNASVMQGKHQGVAHYLHKEHSDMYILGCPCHLMHLAAQKACSKLPASLDELLVDIFYYLDKSSKRKQSLQCFQLLNGKETRKILKHVSTRWLSLGQAITRLLDQWEAVTNFFESELDKSRPKKNRTALHPTSAAAKATSTSKIRSHTHSSASKASSSTSPIKQKKDFDLTSFLFRQNEVAKIAKDASDKKREKAKAKELHTQLSPSVGLIKPVNKVEKVQQLMSNPHVKLYALFLKAVLPIFDMANQAL